MAKTKNKWDKIHDIGSDEPEPSWLTNFGATIGLMVIGALIGSAALGFYPLFRGYFSDRDDRDAIRQRPDAVEKYLPYRKTDNEYRKQVQTEGVGAIYGRQIIGGIIGAAMGLSYSVPHRRRRLKRQRYVEAASKGDDDGDGDGKDT